MTPARDTESLDQIKSRLRGSFLSQLPDRLHQARALLATLGPGTEDRDALQTLHRLFHTLKGSGASFGFTSIEAPAKAAEQALAQVLDGRLAVTEALLTRLHEQVDTLARLDLDPADASDTPHRPSFALPARRPGADRGGDRRERLIYLCDDDPDLIQQLAQQLACFGYQVRPFPTLAALHEAIRAQTPAAVIMDVTFPEGPFAGPEALDLLREDAGLAAPCVFISNRDDFAARLRAVRAAGAAYCPKPIKTVEIVEILDLITDRTPTEPFHVLIVDDDRDLAEYHAMVLESAGMVIRVATAPDQVLGLLGTFSADLVLMDLYMPDCSGPELARVLRQIPDYTSLPIIYVSSETNMDRQFEAMEVGVDGFLTKPIAAERLVTEVRLRAERMRMLHALMVRDSLTGLFNHNTILQFLEVAVASAKRVDRPLCFAMIDIDRFKQVNDTYGHATGDQVLMALSRTLKLRLRNNDLVGRYGGEEFAVILADAAIDEAHRIIETLRAGFAEVVFTSDDREFSCTFSAGLAGFPAFATAEALTEAADQALYRAKDGGRNRVVLARAEAGPIPDAAVLRETEAPNIP
ncbi:diguanylate cyclase [Thioalkalicoccus limnaeus]|uniref:diguanylate cyclase n=1 Tax=Thioalkalicoccus limnaeus TaxID=120681 RepID=A0ABV4BL74_9GAMM